MSVLLWVAGGVVVGGAVLGALVLLLAGLCHAAAHGDEQADADPYEPGPDPEPVEPSTDVLAAEAQDAVTALAERLGNPVHPAIAASREVAAHLDALLALPEIPDHQRNTPPRPGHDAR